jgi:steroid 5-alpha reductase family enzyme
MPIWNNTLLLAWIVVIGTMTILWLVSLALKNSSIVDIFWGAGFVIVTWLVFAATPQAANSRRTLLVALVSIWGLRLAIHILLRNWGKPEDFRYAKWRAENGPRWWWVSFFQVFLLQGILMWALSIPLILTVSFPGPEKLGWLDYLALLIWLIGFIFEAGGDWQLARFKANKKNKGKLLRRGLWRYTRHPNYFGDAAQWWGFYLIALTAGSGWWTIYSPILMTFLLLRVSGVIMLEKTLRENKPGYRDYVESTSAFIPWFPKVVRRPSRKRHL